MSIFKKLLEFIPAGLGLLGQAVGLKPTTVQIKHIGPPHVYDMYGHCFRCVRVDPDKIEYTSPPCPRTHMYPETEA